MFAASGLGVNDSVSAVCIRAPYCYLPQGYGPASGQVHRGQCMVLAVGFVSENRRVPLGRHPAERTGVAPDVEDHITRLEPIRYRGIVVSHRPPDGFVERPGPGDDPLTPRHGPTPRVWPTLLVTVGIGLVPELAPQPGGT